jgi:O-antigen/teichoic acid export membrane protein
MTAVTAAPVRDPGLRRALALSSGGTAAARLTGAVGGVFAARLLGPAGRGQLAVLVFVAIAASMAAAAGMQFWIAREVARGHGVRSVARVVRAHVLVIVVTVPLLGLLAARAIEALAEVGPAAVAATVAVATTAAVSLVLLAVPNGLRAMGVVATATVASGVVYVFGTASLLVGDERSVALVLCAAAFGNVVACAIALSWARRAPRGRQLALPTRQAYRGALAFGWPGGAGELVLLAMLRVDVVIVAAFLPLREVGLYAVATALAEVLWIVPDGVAQVVLPTTARSPERAPTARLLRASSLITAAVGVVLVVVARPAIDVVFGPAFVGAAAAVPLLAVASLAGGVWKIVGAEIVARGTTKPRLTSACLGLAVMVLVDLVAVPAWGIAGAALGSACGYSVAALVVYRAWQARAHA